MRWKERKVRPNIMLRRYQTLKPLETVEVVMVGIMDAPTLSEPQLKRAAKLRKRIDALRRKLVRVLKGPAP